MSGVLQNRSNCHMFEQIMGVFFPQNSMLKKLAVAKVSDQLVAPKRETVVDFTYGQCLGRSSWTSFFHTPLN